MAAKYTFTRPTPAYLSDGTQVVANVPRFEAGKFGKAIMVEKGTTNLVDINNFTFWGASLVDIVHPVTGKTVKAIKLPQGANVPVALSQYLNLSTNTNYTVSFDLWASDNSNAAINIDLWPDTLPEMWETPTTSVQRHVWTFSSSSTDMGNCRLRFFDDSFQPMPNDVYIAMIQLEQKPYATSFINGTRTGESLTIPTAGVLSPTEGTVECWVYVNGVVRRNIASNWPTVVLIRKGTSVANWIWLFHDFYGTWALQIRKEDGTTTGWGSFNDSLTPDGWHYFAIRWNAQAGTADLFHNGVKRASLTGVAFPAEYDRIEIGHRSGGSGDWLNSLIDDLRISSRARSDAEILAAYQSGQPAAVDESTTLKLNFDPFDNADIMIYNDGLVLPFYMQSSRNTKWQLIAPARDDTEEKEAADGDVDFGTTLANSELSLHGIIEYESIQDKNTKKAALAARLNDCRNKKLLALESNPDIGIYVRLKGRPEITEYPSWMDVTIPFSADPFWQSIEEHCCVGSGILTNNGTFETPLVIEITGPVTNPSVVIGDQTLTYTGTVPSGQTLIIDTGNQTVKLNGVNALDKYNGVFPMLQPGDTNVTAASAGTTVFKWRDRWI